MPNKCHDFIHAVMDLKNTIYTDQTGKFRVRSVGGYYYILLTYCYDANAILVEPLPNREASSLVQAWESLHDRLTKNGHITTNYILDNEFSSQLRDDITSHKLKFQLVPPHQHQRNAAERAIRTFKPFLCRFSYL